MSDVQALGAEHGEHGTRSRAEVPTYTPHPGVQSRNQGAGRDNRHQEHYAHVRLLLLQCLETHRKEQAGLRPAAGTPKKLLHPPKGD